MVTESPEITFEEIKRSKPDFSSDWRSDDLEASIKGILETIKKEGSCYEAFNRPEGFCSQCYFGYVTPDHDYDCSLREELGKKLKTYPSNEELYKHMLQMAEKHVASQNK